jgi:Aspartyl protease
VRRALPLLVGILIGQWLAFSGVSSPAEFHRRGLAAWERHDYADALRIWSQGVALQPDNALLHYRRATALARLGQPRSAADAYRLALLLGPPPRIGALVEEELGRLERDAGTVGDGETVVVLEAVRGVWIATVTLNDGPQARFLVDTGSSVTIIAPGLAQRLQLADASGGPVALQTLGGATSGIAATIGSLRLGAAEVRDVPVVVHDPGPGLEGILGNTVLGRYRVTLDPDRRLLHLHR